MHSLVLAVTTRILMPLLLLFSLLLLLRGHHEPGGGFVGGLVAASSFVLVALAEGLQAARRTMRFESMRFVAVGLLLALAAGLIGWAVEGSFLTGVWGSGRWPVIGKPGTAILFEVGVYMVVLGTVTGILFDLMEEEPG
jgi:multicomponent Na+:H+ antiporter subunit B